MCDCRKQLDQRISEMIGKEGQIINFDLISGRTYDTFEYKDGKSKKPKQYLVRHTYCSTCGKKYDEK